ncbi:Histidine-rich glycoprotein [Apodemus speciosus]|uniref:Histidine-rich glycoprotein n=1 Tax=Apodemus speciosus TaxID=105296 RepID=A0ABQ0FLL9_APOSI
MDTNSPVHECQDTGHKLAAVAQSSRNSQTSTDMNQSDQNQLGFQKFSAVLTSTKQRCKINEAIARLAMTGEMTQCSHALSPTNCDASEPLAQKVLDLINKGRRSGYAFQLLRVSDAHLDSVTITVTTTTTITISYILYDGVSGSRKPDQRQLQRTRKVVYTFYSIGEGEPLQMQKTGTQQLKTTDNLKTLQLLLLRLLLVQARLELLILLRGQATVYYLALDVIESDCWVLSTKAQDDCLPARWPSEIVIGQCKVIATRYSNESQDLSVNDYNCTTSSVSSALGNTKDSPVLLDFFEDSELYREQARKALDKYKAENGDFASFRVERAERVVRARGGERTNYYVDFSVRNCSAQHFPRYPPVFGFCRALLSYSIEATDLETPEHTEINCEVFNPERIIKTQVTGNPIATNIHVSPVDPGVIIIPLMNLDAHLHQKERITQTDHPFKESFQNRPLAIPLLVTGGPIDPLIITVVLSKLALDIVHMDTTLMDTVHMDTTLMVTILMVTIPMDTSLMVTIPMDTVSLTTDLVTHLPIAKNPKVRIIGAMVHHMDTQEKEVQLQLSRNSVGSARPRTQRCACLCLPSAEIKANKQVNNPMLQCSSMKPAWTVSKVLCVLWLLPSLAQFTYSQEIDCTDESEFEAVDISLKKFNTGLESSNQFVLYRVTEGTTTDGSEEFYSFTYQIKEGNCSVQSGLDWQDCDFKNAEEALPLENEQQLCRRDAIKTP